MYKTVTSTLTDVINISHRVNHSIRDFASRLIHNEEQKLEDEQWKRDKPLREALRNYITSGGDYKHGGYTIIKHQCSFKVYYMGRFWQVKYHPAEGDNYAGCNEGISLIDMSIDEYLNLDYPEEAPRLGYRPVYR